MKKILLPTLRILVSFGFIGILLCLTKDTLHSIPGILRQMNIRFFIASLVLQVVVIFMIALRFKKILSVHNIKVSFKDASSLTFIGYFFNNFLPSSVGGDLVKAYYSARNSKRKVESLSAVIADRAIGLVTLSLIGVVIVNFLKLENENIRALIYIFFFSLMGSLYVLFHKGSVRVLNRLLSKIRLGNVKEKLKLLYETILIYKGSKRLLFATIILSSLAQLVGVASMYLIARGLYLPISFGLLLVILPIVAVISMFPSINGLGIREGAYVYFLSSTIGRENALTYSLLNLLSLFFVSLIGGLVYLFNRGTFKMEVSRGE